MARTVAIGKQKFDEMREGDFFLVDKTAFIRDWWGSGDDVTLLCRPRRFGKTLTLDMVRCFLSLEFAGRGEELFGGLDVWEDPAMRALQGTVPVVSLSFASCKGRTLAESLAGMKRVIRTTVRMHDYLLESAALNDDDRALLRGVSDDMDDLTATSCLGQLCSMLRRHWGAKPVVLLDEYDTPMQEAWLRGCWDGMSDFVRALFNSTFKTNPDMGRALITGITRVASESIFSDMNNPAVVTTTTPLYEDALGFTEAEVAESLAEFGMSSMMDDVRSWYDGFTFGEVAGIYNPWSITCLLQYREIENYWANSSSNALVSKLVRRGDPSLKTDFEALLNGNTVKKTIDELVDFRRLSQDFNTVWSLLLATGYLRVVRRIGHVPPKTTELTLTNLEVRQSFESMVRAWFSIASYQYNGFVDALLACDAETMCDYLSDLAVCVMSSFDSNGSPSRNLPERFWHGLVLGLLVELRGRYEVRSQPQSGYGRCDVLLCPLDGTDSLDPAFIIEFKVFDKRHCEESLDGTVASALGQIERKRYASALVERGVEPCRIHCFGIAFRGQEVLVGEG